MKRQIENIIVIVSIGALIFIIGYSVNYNDNKISSIKFEDTVAKAQDSVVHIACPRWQGSGFIVDEHIVQTARHVVEGVEDFTITLNDGTKYHATRAISDKTHDLGFIWIDELMPKKNVVKLKSIKDCRLGSDIFIIGSSLGSAHFNNITKGIISKLDLHLEDFGCPSYFGWSQLYNVDAASYPGNSGGPVFDLGGKVIGVLVGGYSGADNLSLCVPIDVSMNDMDFIKLMLQQGKYQFEKTPEVNDDPYYNMESDSEYYKVK